MIRSRILSLEGRPVPRVHLPPEPQNSQLQRDPIDGLLSLIDHMAPAGGPHYEYVRRNWYRIRLFWSRIEWPQFRRAYLGHIPPQYRTDIPEQTPPEAQDVNFAARYFRLSYRYNDYIKNEGLRLLRWDHEIAG